MSDVLLLVAAEYIRPEQREARLAFATRWQQFTGSIMAKGMEDTALYIYFPLASLNEVGGDPRLSLADPSTFHELIARRQKNWPNSMNATTTHDTKRSEDARARGSLFCPRFLKNGRPLCAVGHLATTNLSIKRIRRRCPIEMRNISSTKRSLAFGLFMRGHGPPLCRVFRTT